MTDPAARAARAARAAGAILAPDLGSGLPAEVEAAIHESETGWERPGQYEVAVIAGLAISAASLIVTAAQLAWSIVSEHRSNEPVPSHDSITRQIRITLRETMCRCPTARSTSPTSLLPRLSASPQTTSCNRTRTDILRAPTH